jgi:hypothetical protein
MGRRQPIGKQAFFIYTISEPITRQVLKMFFTVLVLLTALALFAVFLFMPLLFYYIRVLSAKKKEDKAAETFRNNPIGSFLQTLLVLLVFFVILAILVYKSDNQNAERPGPHAPAPKINVRISPETAGPAAKKGEPLPRQDGPTVVRKILSLPDPSADSPPGEGSESGGTYLNDLEKERTVSITGSEDLDFSANAFSPSTIKFDVVKEESDPKEDPDALLYAKIEGAKAGDFFVYAFYDDMSRGKFTRSENAGFTPPKRPAGPEAGTGSIVKVTTVLPRFAKDEPFQVPFLINGIVLPEGAQAEGINLFPDGKASPFISRIEKAFSYSILRIPAQGAFTASSKGTEWLTKETNDMPQEILTILEKVKSGPPEEKLSSVALILNSYFGYQTGQTDLFLSGGATWNSTLLGYVADGKKLLCDCDVLCAYAYLYLKYLGFDPVLVIGFLITPRDLGAMNRNDLHATLYVQASPGKWLFFDPTAFTFDYNDRKDGEKGIGPKLRDESTGRENYIGSDGINKVLKDSEMDHFMLSQKELEQIYPMSAAGGTEKNRSEQTALGIIATLGHGISEIERLNLRANSLSYKTPLELMIKIALAAYGASALLVAAASLLTKRVRLFPFTGARKYLLLLCLGVFIASILIRVEGTPFGFWANDRLLRLISAYLLCITAFLSMVSAAFCAAPDPSPKRTLGAGIMSFMRYRLQLTTLNAIGAAAVLFAPSAVTFVALAVSLALSSASRSEIA